MKISRAKKVHKNLSFFATNFGFRQPYQILVDGTLCFSALKSKINLQEQLPKYFGAAIKLLTTQCVIVETEKLGPALYGAMMIVKQFAVHRCGHSDEPITGSACILSMIGRKNTSRYIVATQDQDLQERIRKIPGTPLFYIHHQTPTLEAPSQASLKMAQKQNEAKFGADQQPGEQISEVKKRVLGEEETPEPRKPRRKRPGGPNPLSCKKKKKTKPNTISKPKPEKANRRSRKRVKVPQHVKDHLTASVNENASK